MTRTWEAVAERLSTRIEEQESLDEKLTRLLRAGRGMWHHYIRLTITKDKLVTARPVDEEALKAVELKMRTVDAELYAVESQIKATDRAILALPAEADPVIVMSSVWAAGKRRRLRERR